jgi:uncharacterized protein
MQAPREVMKRIGVISDTHLRMPDASFEKIASKNLLDVDILMHAGDMVSLSILDIFFAWGKEVIAVCGNMDDPEVRRTYPSTRTVTIEGVRVGIIHGWGPPESIRQRILPSFHGVDAIIYGHTHQAFSGVEAGVFFFNPGSPTDSRFTTDRSIGIIEVCENTIKGAIVIV